MPSHKAQEKSLRKDEKRHAFNASTKAKLRTLVKRVRTAVAEKNKDAAIEQMKVAVSALDTAAKRHIIHPRNASRRKSRLMHLVSSLDQPAAE